MNRRKFVALAGGGVILAAGTGGFLVTRTPDKALQPWQDAGSVYSDPRKKALSYAILAPNPHNRQPWLIDLSKVGQATIYVDTDRLLPHTDPYSRQITIGLGCFLELMRMAAGHDGFRVDMDLFPQGQDSEALDRRPIAIATFVKDSTVKPDPLFKHVLARRSLKEPYDMERAVSSEVLSKLQAVTGDGVVSGSSNDRAVVQSLRALTRDAMIVEIETHRTYKESVDLFRIGKSEVEANPDGIDFSGPMFETMHLTGLFSREAALDRTSSSFSQGREIVLKSIDATMAHFWLGTPGNSRNDQINAGRDWLRVNLAATSLGLGIQPLSQALQEYPEMATHYEEIHRMVAPEGGTVQMLARLGYGASIPQSPRWPLSAKIMKEQV
ncbi:twin-arginine translocation pathway signal protein [Pelagibius sp. Alg239-R121]|uniref:Acg family FMN-binding oxidoreductase n=1 Tax=Pelagibius sp. Alg239-R121 TaxID=2993448 RepID=UPI0024A6CA68|nr:twin-arginine translocation pathway signal protein [Pelagibius sp. Alg239-R121]